ncbi:Uncharacterised protein [Vibrio cholerae]|nr:Uncharacterised protein [Vibrio cholerae]CSC98636.1 Uncharacterised protein [Vibrio cholerae]
MRHVFLNAGDNLFGAANIRALWQVHIHHKLWSLRLWHKARRNKLSAPHRSY